MYVHTWMVPVRRQVLVHLAFGRRASYSDGTVSSAMRFITNLWVTRDAVKQNEENGFLLYQISTVSRQIKRIGSSDTSEDPRILLTARDKKFGCVCWSAAAVVPIRAHVFFLPVSLRMQPTCTREGTLGACIPMPNGDINIERIAW